MRDKETKINNATHTLRVNIIKHKFVRSDDLG